VPTRKQPRGRPPKIAHPEVFCLRLPAQVLQQLREVSEGDHRSVNDLVSEAVERWLVRRAASRR
jgi:hypothetical protein